MKNIGGRDSFITICAGVKIWKNVAGGKYLKRVD